MGNYNDIGALSVRMNLDTSDFNKKISAINKEIRFLERDFKSAGKGIKNFENSFVGVNKKIQTLTQQLGYAKTKLEEQQKQYEKHKASLKENQIAMEKYAKELGETSKEYLKSKEAVKDYANKLRAVDTALKTTRGQINQYTSALEEAREKMKAMESGTISFAEKLNKLEAESKETEASFEAMVNSFSKGSFSRAEAEMDKLASSIEQAKKKISLYTSEISNLQSSQKKLQSSQDKISSEIKETANALEKAKSSYGESSAQVEKLTDKLMMLKTKLAETRVAFNNNTSAITNYKTQMHTLAGSVALMSNQMTNIPADTVANKFNSIGRSMATTGMMMSATIGLPLTMLGKSAVTTAMNFEEGMSKVQAISNATGDQMAVLTRKAEDLGRTTHFTASEVADGMGYLSMAGLDVNEVLEGMESQLNLAKAGMLDLGTTADITTNIMSGFGQTASDLEHISDVLAYASSNANTNIEQMGEAMVYLAPVGQTLGLSLEDVSSAVMAVSDSGIQGARAGAAFSTSLTRLTKPTEQMEVLMEELGVTFATAEGTMKPIHQIVGELNTAMDGYTETQKAAAINTLFGAEATKHWASLLAVGEDKLKANKSALEDCDGTAQRMAETMGDNLAGAVKEMQSKLEGFLNTVGKVLAPTIKVVAEKIGELTEWFQELSPATQNAIITTGALAIGLPILGTALGFVVSGLGNFIKFGKMFNSIGGSMVGKITGIGSATQTTAGLMTRAAPLLLNPWTLLIGSLAGVGTAFYVMNKKSKSAMEEMSKTAHTTANGVGDYFTKDLPEKLELATDQINSVSSEILGDNTKRALNHNIAEIQKALETGTGNISHNFERIVKLVTDDFDKIPPEMRQSVAEGIAEFGEMLARDGQIAVGEFQSLVNKLNEDANVTLEFDYSSIMDAQSVLLYSQDFTKAMESVGTSLKSGYNDIEETVNATVDVMTRGSDMGDEAFRNLVASTTGYIGDLKGNVNHFNSVMQQSMEGLYDVLSPQQMGIMMWSMVQEFELGTEGIQLVWDGMYADLENTDEAGRQAILQGMGAFISEAGQWSELLAGTYGEITQYNNDFWVNMLAGMDISSQELNGRVSDLVINFTERMTEMSDPSQIAGLLLNLDEIVNRLISTKELSTEEANALKDQVNLALAGIDPEVITKITADTSQFTDEELAVINKLLALHEKSATPTVDADTSEAKEKIDDVSESADKLEENIESKENEVTVETDEAVDDLEEVSDTADDVEKNIESKTNKVTVDGSDAIKTLDTIQTKINNLGDKTVKVNVNTNYTTTGTPSKESKGVTPASLEPVAISDMYETNLEKATSSFAKVNEAMASLDYSSAVYRSQSAPQQKTLNVSNNNDSTMIKLMQSLVEQMDKMNQRQNTFEAKLYLDSQQIASRLETKTRRENRLRGY